MKILALSDEESRYYYEYYQPGRFDGIDLIVSCGDLGRNYLEFIATMAHAPVVYVRGNHDDGLKDLPPGGCLCAEDSIVVCQGLRILGLGGSYRYRDGENMYTESQMQWRIRKLWLQLKIHHGFDILLAHAPARHLNDFDSLSHQGFSCFLPLLERYEPKYFIHGHIHRNYGVHIPRRSSYGATTVINAFEHYLFDYDT